MTSCLSPCSALSLVRQRIHALRQSMELLMKLISLGDDFMIVSVFSAELGRCGYMHCVCLLWIWISRLFSVKVDLDP